MCPGVRIEAQRGAVGAVSSRQFGIAEKSKDTKLRGPANRAHCQSEHAGLWRTPFGCACEQKIQQISADAWQDITLETDKSHRGRERDGLRLVSIGGRWSVCGMRFFTAFWAFSRSWATGAEMGHRQFWISGYSSPYLTATGTPAEHPSQPDLPLLAVIWSIPGMCLTCSF